MVLRLRHLYTLLTILCLTTGILISYQRYDSMLQYPHNSILTKGRFLSAKSHIEQAQQYFYIDVNIYAAISEYQKVLAVEPNNIQALTGLAEVLECTAPSLASQDMTKHVLYQILDTDPNNQYAYVTLLNLLIGGSEQEILEAENLISKAPASLLRQPDLAKLRATLLVKQNKSSQALSVLQHALNQYPNDIQLLYATAYLYYLQNNFTSAKTHITRAIHLANTADNFLLAEMHSLHDLIEVAFKTGHRPKEYY